MIKIIVLLLPTQLGFHFWPAFSRVVGIKIDYLSPTLYLIDPLLLLLILLNIKSLLLFIKKNIISVGVFISFIVLNITFSVSPPNSIFWWIRICLYLLTLLNFKIRHLKWEDVRTPLLCGTIFVVILEIAQLFLQSSVGGVFYYFGERAYSASTTGIGRFNLFGLEILRPTSIFSHPNSLAGYLLVVFLLFSVKSSRPWQKLIPFMGIIFTFSKTAILFLALLVFNLKPEIIILASIIFTIAQPLISNTTYYWQPISDRLFYFSYLKRIITSSPFFGVGLGNFIPSLAKLLPGSHLTLSNLQPIHNLLYLFISELGIVGSLLFVLLIIRQKISKILANKQILMLIALVLFIGAFDHYFWTLPQNKLIVILAIAILF